MSAFSEFFFGKPSEAKQLPLYTDQQQQLISNLLSSLGGPLSSGIGNLSQLLSGSPEAFKSFEQPALTQFQQELVPQIAEKFAGLGGLSSSGFQQTLGQAASNLSERLSAQRSGLQSQALQQLMSLLGQGMQPQFQYAMTPGSSGLFGGASQGIGSFLGRGLGRLLGI